MWQAVLLCRNDVQSLFCGIQTKKKKKIAERNPGAACLCWVGDTKHSQVQENKAKRTEGSTAREKEGNKVGNVGDFPVNSAHISLSVDPPPDPQTGNTTAHPFTSSSFLCL